MSTRANAVIVGLIVLLSGGLLFCVIVKVRDSERRVQCTQNLEMMGLGLCNYHACVNRFPPGTIANPALRPERRLSWYVDAWGFVGDGQLGLVIDRSKAWDAEENIEPRIHFYDYEEQGRDREEAIGHCRSWLCPANPNRAPEGMPGLTHYVGVAGVGPDAAELPGYNTAAGVFGYDRQTRLEDIKDGASFTLLIMETATANGPWTAGGPPTVRGLEPGKLPYLGPAGQFSTRHRPHVTHAAFADGSVRSLATSVNPEVLEALATIAGGEAVPDDF
jgi:hypothetical protein